MNQNAMRRKLQCWYENSRSSSGTAGIPIKETTRKEEQPIQNKTLNATNVEVPSTSSRNVQCGKIKKERERQGIQKDYKAKETQQN